MEMFVTTVHLSLSLSHSSSLPPPISLLPFQVSTRENTTLFCHFEGFYAVGVLQAWWLWDGKEHPGVISAGFPTQT